MQGRSLKERLGGRGTAKGEVFFEKDFRPVPGLDPSRCLLWLVRDERHKYVEFAAPSMPAILYDLESDPKELVNVAGRPEYRDVALDMCRRLVRWRMANEDQRMAQWASRAGAG
jgi:hypothetical protein